MRKLSVFDQQITFFFFRPRKWLRTRSRKTWRMVMAGRAPPRIDNSKEWMVIGLDFIYNWLFHNNLIIPFSWHGFFFRVCFLLCEWLKHDVGIGISHLKIFSFRLQPWQLMTMVKKTGKLECQRNRRRRNRCFFETTRWSSDLWLVPLCMGKYGYQGWKFAKILTGPPWHC